jgi:hypothetical protein
MLTVPTNGRTHDHGNMAQSSKRVRKQSFLEMLLIFFPTIKSDAGRAPIRSDMLYVFRKAHFPCED